ncbi:hypothetical protein KFK09_019740 [Dendrobium nobile]|uniref:DNA-directed RNA polymerase I subunit RPA12 n=1 Tax=Dendrobium nobile TaxID=94219 RepID=A0A8T3AS31_DENNO|nr:hypothetical protein KFK09_019740 [Dendrobium nobile]
MGGFSTYQYEILILKLFLVMKSYLLLMVNANDILGKIEGKEIRYTITAEDIRRELKIEPFVILESAPQIEEEKVQRAVVNETCPKCNNSQLEYYTKQLRSADEGQTVFYECPKCWYKYSLNT